MDYKRELVENILPFWLENAIDYKNGGIYTQLDETGAVYGTEKSVWFQGRALWTFSKVYNIIDQNQKYLKAADYIYRFLPKCTDTDGRMYFTVTEDGRELQKRRYYFSETFAAIGCAEYYKATGNNEALIAAEKYFDVAYECFCGIRKTTPKINPNNAPMKALSPVMIMLSTTQTMRSVCCDNINKYDKIAGDCVNEILHGGFLTEHGLLESVSIDGNPINSPTGRVVNPGHSLEAAWFLLMEGYLTGNEEVIRKGKQIIDITWPLGWDEKNGGIFAFRDISGKPPMQLEWDMKLWWPQCEAMIAMRLAYLIFGEESYAQRYQMLEKYCERHFIDAQNGEWYGYLHYDNTPSTTLKGNIFKGPFHIPRLYMIMSVLDEDGCIKRYAQ